MRNKVESIADRLLLLFAIAKANEVGVVDGPFKLMKIPFMAELESTRKGVNTFNYRFYRYTYGPMTTEIYEDGDALHNLGLATDKTSHIKVTEKGNELLTLATDLFEQNKEVCSYVENAAKRIAPLTFGPIKKRVYREKVVVDGESVTIADAPTYSTVLSPSKNAVLGFSLDDDWIDTLWAYFNYTDEEMAGLSVIRPMVRESAAIQ